MTQEEKGILLKDLCSRLPYKVKFGIGSCKLGVYDLVEINTKKNKVIYGTKLYVNLESCKPYLRPMSSMTEDEKRELLKYGAVVRLENAEVADVSCTGFDRHAEVQDWLNAHHFDFRNLIEKGLAIEVTEENNPYKAELS